MPLALQRALRIAHRWVGLVLSLLLAVIALSGTLLVFKDDWTRLTVPDARQQAALDREALARVLDSAGSRLGDRGLTALRFGTETLGVHRAYFLGGGGAFLDRDGHVVEEWSRGGRAEDWLLDLHHRLLAGDAGHWIAGGTALATVLLVVSGLAVWWPTRRAFRNRLWPRSSRRGELMTAHRELGVWVSLPLLVLCLTGAAMIFPAPSVALLGGLLGGEAPPAAPVPAVASPPPDIAWRDALEAGHGQFPDATLRIVSWPRDGATATLRYRQPAEWHPNGRSVVQYRPGQGVVHHLDATSLGRGLRVFNTFYPLHSARIGGPLVKAAVAVSGLAATLICLFGAWSFFRRPGSFKSSATGDTFPPRTPIDRSNR